MEWHGIKKKYECRDYLKIDINYMRAHYIPRTFQICTEKNGVIACFATKCPFLWKVSRIWFYNADLKRLKS